MPPVKQVAIYLNTARLDYLLGQVKPRAMALLDKVAFDIEATAKPMTNYDTGAMRSSIYVSGASGGQSEYSAASAEALGRRPGIELAAEVKPAHEMERVIGVAVEYAYWQELQHPYLEPAVDQHRRGLEAAWRELLA